MIVSKLLFFPIAPAFLSCEIVHWLQLGSAKGTSVRLRVTVVHVWLWVPAPLQWYCHYLLTHLQERLQVHWLEGVLILWRTKSSNRQYTVHTVMPRCRLSVVSNFTNTLILILHKTWEPVVKLFVSFQNTNQPFLFHPLTGLLAGVSSIISVFNVSSTVILVESHSLGLIGVVPIKVSSWSVSLVTEVWWAVHTFFLCDSSSKVIVQLGWPSFCTVNCSWPISPFL